MPDDNQNSKISLSRRKILTATGAIGASGLAAGLSSKAFFNDSEQLGNNQLVAGELDLKVGWEVRYFDWIDSTPQVISESDFTDDPGPIVQLEDVKPGDVIVHTLNARITGNPAFLSIDCFLTDSDNGITEPEDMVDGQIDDSDGTPGGDLGDALRMVVWFDDGDGLPQEIWDGDFPDTEEEFIMAVGDADRPSEVFDLDSPNLAGSGTAVEICRDSRLLNPQINGHVAGGFPNSFCYESAETESIGVLLWVPNDIPGVNDNIIQTDRCEYQIRFSAVQCRHNVANDGGPWQSAENVHGKENTKYGLLEYPDVSASQAPNITEKLEFKNQLTGGKYDDFEIKTPLGIPEFLEGLLEPVKKSDNHKNPPPTGAQPDLLPLTMYPISGGNRPKYNMVEVDDPNFGHFKLKIGLPVFFFDPVTEKETDKIMAKPEKWFPTPMVAYRVDVINSNDNGPDVGNNNGPDVGQNIATRDQFTDQAFEVRNVDLFVEPVKKKRNGKEQEHKPEHTARPLIGYKISFIIGEEDPVGLSRPNLQKLRVNDQFVTHPDAYELDLNPPKRYYQHVNKIKKDQIERSPL